jgi:putative ABC transport system permease protein
VTTTLTLDNIHKSYRNGQVVAALRGVSLRFGQAEFVAIVGPSGCGKTTLLNVIGGLDHYDQGDLVIGGRSTNWFKDAEWDAYRNHAVGFVFQSYNLISHLTVQRNVELALALSGVSATQRQRRASQALAEVGLADQATKRPNQLSGGQMQRVAVARALVNNPEILLADEPTGALDSRSSVQLMELLAGIAETRLVIMVTHNTELAAAYATRIVRMQDGEVLWDQPVQHPTPTRRSARAEPSAGLAARLRAAFRRPPTADRRGLGTGPEPAGPGPAPATAPAQFTKTAMSLATATGLSFRNLLTKRGRTLLTAFAGSIGIIGVALVLALSAGLTSYMNTMQTDTLTGFPITITTSGQTFDIGGDNPFTDNEDSTAEEFPDDGEVRAYDPADNQGTHTNVLTAHWLDYVADLPSQVPDSVQTMSYQRGVQMNLLADSGSAIVQFSPSDLGQSGFSPGDLGALGTGSPWQEMPDSEDFVLSLYDLIAGQRLPSAAGDIALVVDEYNRVDTALLTALGLADQSYLADDLVGRTILRILDNDDFYTSQEGLFSPATPAEFAQLWDSPTATELTIVAVLRPKPEASTYFSPGLIYTPALTDQVVASAEGSAVAQAQLGSDTNVLTGASFADDQAKADQLIRLGADTTPTGVSIYPVDFAAKDAIEAYLDAYNEDRDEADQVIYTDLAATIASMTTTLLNTVSSVLIGFAAISLIVSTIMIGIITYVSVIERTSEIGILRAVGARKKDISRVFNTEAAIIGLAAGLLGVGLAWLATIPINSVIESLTDIAGLATLNPTHGLILVAGSIGLTLIASFLPARIAAAKDPVEALRAQ